MHNKYAEFALNLVNVAPIKGAEAESVAAVKRWLQQIGNGQLVVSQPKVKKPKAPTP